MIPEVAIVGAASGLVVAMIAVATFWAARHSARAALRERVTGCERAADEALRAAAGVDNDLRDFYSKNASEISALHLRVEAANAAWTVRWETALREFVSHDTMRDIERRLVEAGTQSERRLMDAITGLTRRVDNVMDGRGAGGK